MLLCVFAHVISVYPLTSQEEYYVTHQCFLSSRSLYLAVWNVTHGEKGIEDLGPWLHNIQVHKSYPNLSLSTSYNLLMGSIT